MAPASSYSGWGYRCTDLALLNRLSYCGSRLLSRCLTLLLPVKHYGITSLSNSITWLGENFAKLTSIKAAARIMISFIIGEYTKVLNTSSIFRRASLRLWPIVISPLSHQVGRCNTSPIPCIYIIFDKVNTTKCQNN